VLVATEAACDEAAVAVSMETTTPSLSRHAHVLLLLFFVFNVRIAAVVADSASL